MCAEKRYEEAYELFHYFFNVNCVAPDDDSCGYVLNALSYQGRLDEAIQFYRRAQSFSQLDLQPHALVKALINVGRIDEAYHLFFRRFGSSHVVFIRGYLAHGNIDMANEVFENLKQRSKYSNWRDEEIAMSQVAYMEHCFKVGKGEEAMEWYHSALAKRAASGYVSKPAVNKVLRVLLENGKKTEAWSLFDKLCGNSDTEKDEETRCIMLEECFETGEISKAMEMARKEARAGNSRCYTTVLTRLLREGMMSEAEEIFNQMFSSGRIPLYSDLSIYPMMVDGFVKAGRFDDAHRFVNKIADVSLGYVSRKGHHSGGLAFVS